MESNKTFNLFIRDRFMTLKKGDTVVTLEGMVWLVQLDAALSGNIPKVLLSNPADEIPQFFHLVEEKRVIMDDDGNSYPQLTSARIHYNVHTNC
jgi:hypothetical protein